MYCHLVFGVKNRSPLLTPDITPRVYAYIGGILRDMKGAARIIGGTQDHVHILASLHPEDGPSVAMRNVKAGSSKWIHATFPEMRRFAWQDGYGSFSVGYDAIETVKRYIAHQEDHHKLVTYQDELRSFLRRHEIEVDERYWDAEFFSR